MIEYSPKNILCLGLEWFPTSPGGTERYVFELTSHLAACGDHVQFWGYGLPNNEQEDLVNLTNLGEPNFFILRRLCSVRKHFLNSDFNTLDAINLHFPLYSLPLISKLPVHVPITLTFHGPWALEAQWEGNNKLSVFVKKLVEQMVHRRCDRFIVLSKAFGSILHESYKVPWDKIYIIPGGVDTQVFSPTLSSREARESLGWPQDRPIIFTPRRLVQRMGLEKLLKVIEKIKHRVPSIWLAIAGKGVLKTTLEMQIKELGLSNHVNLLGFLPDFQLPIAYQAADLTVVPSQALEGFGLVLLESLACGTPVLCTPIGGMPEVLEAFSPDLITESIEADAICNRLEKLLTGEILMPSSKACREYAEKNFNWSKISSEVRKIILAPNKLLR